jgi:hypothetical protein
MEMFRATRQSSRGNHCKCLLTQEFSIPYLVEPLGRDELQMGDLGVAERRRVQVVNADFDSAIPTLPGFPAL